MSIEIERWQRGNPLILIYLIKIIDKQRIRILVMSMKLAAKQLCPCVVTGKNDAAIDCRQLSNKRISGKLGAAKVQHHINEIRYCAGGDCLCRQ